MEIEELHLYRIVVLRTVAKVYVWNEQYEDALKLQDEFIFDANPHFPIIQITCRVVRVLGRVWNKLQGSYHSPTYKKILISSLAQSLPIAL